MQKYLYKVQLHVISHYSRVGRYCQNVFAVRDTNKFENPIYLI